MTHKRFIGIIAGVVLLCGGIAASGADNYWTGPAAGSWNDAGSWSGGVPVWDSAAWITNTTARTVTNGLNDIAWSLYFTNANHTLLGGNLWLGSGLINVAGSRVATINSSLAGKAGLVKAGGGALSLGNATNLITGGIVLNAGTLTPANVLALGNNPILLNAGTFDVVSGAGLYTYIRELSGSGTVRLQYNRGLVMNSLQDSTFSGTYDASYDNSGSPLLKTGPGTFTVTTPWRGRTQHGPWTLWRGGLTYGGASGSLVFDFTMAPTIYGGTLTLDESVADIDRVSDNIGWSVGSGGGTIRYLGAANTVSAETLSTLTMSGKGAALNLVATPGSGGTAAVTFASYSISTGDGWSSVAGMLNVITTGTLGDNTLVRFATPPGLVNNVLPGGFVNGTDIATYHSTPTGTNGVMAFGSSGSGTSYVNPANVNTPAATDVVLIDSDTTTLALSADRTFSALKIDGAYVLDLNGNNLTVGTAVLETMVVKTGAGEAEIRGTTAGKYLRQYVSGSNNQSRNYAFMVNQDTLKISAPLLGGSLSLRVNKMGSGVLWLDPAQPWGNTQPYSTSFGNGGIFFSEGVIRLDPRDTDFGNETMVLNGGVMEITGGGTYSAGIGQAAKNVMWLSSGGFAALGSDVTFASNITWNAANHIPDGGALLLNSATADSKITLAGTINLGTDLAKMYLREMSVADNSGTNTDLAEISGQIISDTGTAPTITYHLVKTGAGTLILSHTNNTYSGATYVKEGALLVNGALAAPASTEVARNPEYTAVTVMNGGTLGGTGTIDRVVRVASGGTLSPGNSTGILTIDDDASLTNGATLRLEINGLTAGAEHDQLKLTAGNLVVSNATLSLSWGAFSVSGPTNIWIVNHDGSGLTLGQFAGLTNDASVGTHNGAEWFITYDGDYTAGLDGGNDIVLYTMIPEPSAWALVVCGLLATLVLRRRRA